MSRKKQPGKKCKKPEQTLQTDAEVYKKLYENTGPAGINPTKSLPKVEFQKSISKTPSKSFGAFGRYLKHKFGENIELEKPPTILPKKRKKPSYCFKNLYDIFKLPPNSDKNEICKSYRKQVVIHHPDKGGDALIFRCINKAYEILSNPDLRQIYDNEGLNGLKVMNELDLTELEMYLNKLSD